MDSFESERTDLTGSLVTLEFGNGGRVTQLWASDPALPDEGEEFQFVLPPIQFGEENSDDYLPGTILIGARIDPNNRGCFLEMDRPCRFFLWKKLRT